MAFSHIEINVGDYARSIRFYDLVLAPLGWERFVCTKSHTAYCDGAAVLVIGPVDEKFRGSGFHRKRMGLNHLAFSLATREAVDRYYAQTLRASGISTLYQEGPSGDDAYYSVLFEDPDRMKIEVVCAPGYTKRECWPNTIVSDFDPYASGH